MTLQLLEAWSTKLRVGWLSPCDTSEALERCRRQRPTFVVVNVDFLYGDGLGVAEALVQRLPYVVQIVALLSICREGTMLRIQQAGIAHVLMRTAMMEDGFGCVVAAIRGGSKWISPEFQSACRQFERDPHSISKILSPREIELLRDFGTGKFDTEVADGRGLSIQTVHTHRKNIMRKLRLHCISDVIAAAINLGLVTAGDLRCRHSQRHQPTKR